MQDDVPDATDVMMLGEDVLRRRPMGFAAL
jgi:hypothetical protein